MSAYTNDDVKLPKDLRTLEGAENDALRIALAASEKEVERLKGERDSFEKVWKSCDAALEATELEAQVTEKKLDEAESRAEKAEAEVKRLEAQLDLPPDDVCCCGDSMKNHANAYSCGHSPVSMRDHYLSQASTPSKRYEALMDVASAARASHGMRTPNGLGCKLCDALARLDACGEGER